MHCHFPIYYFISEIRRHLRPTYEQAQDDEHRSTAAPPAIAIRLSRNHSHSHDHSPNPNRIRVHNVEYKFKSLPL